TILWMQNRFQRGTDFRIRQSDFAEIEFGVQIRPDADDEDSLPVLRHKQTSVNDSLRYSVTKILLKRPHDDVHSPALVMRAEILDVLKDEGFGLLRCNDPGDIEEKGSLRLVQEPVLS